MFRLTIVGDAKHIFVTESFEWMWREKSFCNELPPVDSPRTPATISR